ncbi:MAG: hypothetical protein NT080_12595 [Spirochaetes bacterium]|nr:hypothetical protein [Spirochaetota bacterium]
MNRRIRLLVIFIALAATFAAGSAAAQVRLDLGVDIPRGFGALSGGDIFTPDAVDFLDQTILPFPEAGIYYQWDLGVLKVGAGLRCFTFIAESIFWPNLIAEAHLGNFVVEGQMGGGYFGVFGLASSSASGNVFIPELSAWYKIGESFRLGGGAIGLFLPDLTSDTIPFIYYLGAKFSITFK